MKQKGNMIVSNFIMNTNDKSKSIIIIWPEPWLGEVGVDVVRSLQVQEQLVDARHLSRVRVIHSTPHNYTSHKTQLLFS